MRSRLPVQAAVLAVAAVLVGAMLGACALGSPAPGPPAVRSGPVATLAPPSPAARASVPTPAQWVPPHPIPIPADSYASEPVVVYGSIEIPAIGLRHTLYQGVTLHNIDRGPSHWTGSARPGERGNAVIAGHRATHGEPFRRLDELKPGDEVVFRVAGVRSVYRVTSDLVVGPDALWIADQTPESTATLYTCHPPGSDAYRYVVRMVLAGSGPDA